MRGISTAIAAFVLSLAPVTSGQAPVRTLVAVWAHADDETPVGPVLARYAQEGVRVHMIIATDGSQGAANTTVPRGPEIARLRVEEARCSAQALGWSVHHSRAFRGWRSGRGAAVDGMPQDTVFERLC